MEVRAAAPVCAGNASAGGVEDGGVHEPLRMRPANRDVQAAMPCRSRSQASAQCRHDSAQTRQCS
jgi:hypothetical protein